MTATVADLDLIREAMVALDVPARDLEPESRLREDLDIDSTELVELASYIADEIGVRVTAKEVKGIGTVAELAGLVNRLRVTGSGEQSAAGPPATTAGEAQHIEHTVTIAANLGEVWNIITDLVACASLAPGPKVVQIVEQSGDVQVARVTVDTPEGARSFLTRRELDHGRLLIRYRQLKTLPGVAQMSGRWQCSRIDEEHTRLVLVHDFAASSPGDGTDPGMPLATVIATQSRQGLEAIKQEAERRALAEV